MHHQLASRIASHSNNAPASRPRFTPRTMSRQRHSRVPHFSTSRAARRELVPSYGNGVPFSSFRAQQAAFVTFVAVAVSAASSLIHVGMVDIDMPTFTPHR
jgi:hypothetical protein